MDIEAALAELPAPQRAAVVLVDMHDVPVAEAAEILGVAVGTIKSRCSRARTALARILRADAVPGPGPAAPGTGPRQVMGNLSGFPAVTGETNPPTRRSRREALGGSAQETTW
jgi:RNA polymerase sigma-70 factor (ECF subfamily)